MKYNFIILSIFIFVSVFFLTKNVFSQSFDISGIIDPNTGLPVGIDEQISIEQIPKIPKPGEMVSIRITSYMTDLNKAKITWSQDGLTILSQTGAITNQIQAPESGKSTKIVLTIQKENGGIITKTITLHPADVDLIYETNTYSHPFFKGKKLFTSESYITFIAIPNFIGADGKKIPSSNLVYTWKVNGTVQQSVSGYGKDTFSTKGQLIERPLEIEVNVSAINSTLVAKQTLNIKSTLPELLLYENNPLLGVVYEKAILGSFLLQRSQVDFEGVPYFFSVNTKNDSSLSYKWKINGTSITSKAPQENYLLLQNNNNEEGRALISATLNHTQNILQTAQTSLELTFKKIKETTNEVSSF